LQPYAATASHALGNNFAALRSNGQSRTGKQRKKIYSAPKELNVFFNEIVKVVLHKNFRHTIS